MRRWTEEVAIESWLGGGILLVWRLLCGGGLGRWFVGRPGAGYDGGARSWTTRFGVAESANRACNNSPRFRVSPHENQPWFKVHSQKDTRHNSVF